MRETPFFVPYGEDHLAAVLCVPEEAPRALVLLLQGGSSTRGHNNQKWTRLARELAGLGIASVRMDYVGMGDSTGSYQFEVAAPPVEQAEAVLFGAQEALGMTEYAVVGNCIGLRTAFTLAGRVRGCLGVAAIFSRSMGPILAPREKDSTRPAPPPRARPRSRFHPRRLLAGALRRLRRKRRALVLPVMPEFARVLTSTEVLMLHAATDQWERRLEATAQAIERSRRGQPGPHIKLIRVPSRELEKQAAVVSTVSRWMDRILPGSSPRSQDDREQPGVLATGPGASHA
ncbi:MAG: hypothetical protein M3Q23_08680 [Actinomycetota bacterium]|nr:hypothetical protein [Actinomycetota bacterium]